MGKQGLGCVCFASAFMFAVQKNTVKYFITVKTAFYTAGPTKKLNLKRSFYEVFFTCFFN
jgi:hypothetical protein